MTSRSTSNGPPIVPLAVLALVLYLLLPVRLVHARFVKTEQHTSRMHANAKAIDQRASAARRVDQPRLQADLQAVRAAMPGGGIEGWINAVSGLARSTGTTWRSATVSSPAPETATAGEVTPTTIAVIAEGPMPGLLAFVDQLRVGPPRLTLVDEFAVSVDPKDARRGSVTLKVRLLSFVPSDPPPPATV